MGLYLDDLKANMVAKRAGLRIILLIRVCIQKEDHLVGLHSALQEEDEEGTCPAHLQVVRQQVGNSFVDEGLGDNIAGEAGLYGIGTDLHTELQSLLTQLKEKHTKK